MDSSPRGQVLMARQPIFDSGQKVIAYELLYRNDQDTEQAVFRDASATIEVLLNAYTSISDAGSVKRVPAFINISEDMLTNDAFPELPRKQVVIEIPATIKPTKEIVKAILSLARDGYRLVLDNYTNDPHFDPILKIVHMVKVDVSALSDKEMHECVSRLRFFKVTPIAIKIESGDKLLSCSQMGFKLFQGHFLSRPKLVKGKKLESNAATLMQLMQAINQPDVTPEDLEKLIIQDPVLTFKMLRIVNSAAYSLVRKVESITDAVVLLGMEQIRRWVTLISMTSHDDKPEELCRMLLIRGAMCEALARATDQRNAGSYFMAGMMSGLHALLGIDQASLLEQVPLADDIQDAVRDYAGPIGETLKAVIAYESGNWNELPLDMDIDLYESAYRHSLQWTQDAMQAIRD
ncbi:EAL and HDOD domain-containing protein [Pontibacterium sp.]|uniref:EAL and HDOD domain-containing protein n=1 Tax=Pontibacterium sp. TaxID=2036026 RepID=UPI003512AD16